MKISGKYWNAIKVSLIFQIAICLLTSLITDLGQTFQIWAITMAAYWIGAIVIMLRRPQSPTRIDLFLARWAFPFLFMLAFPVTTLVWKMRGIGE